MKIFVQNFINDSFRKQFLALFSRIQDFQKILVLVLNNIQRIISFSMKQKDFSPLKWKNKNQKNYQSSGSLFNTRMSASARLKNRSQKPQLKKQISLFTTETSAIFDDDTNLIERTESNPFFKEKLKVKLNKHQKILQQLDKKQQPKPPSNKNLSTTLKQMRKQQKQEVLQSFSKIIENSKSKSVKDLWFKIK